MVQYINSYTPRSRTLQKYENRFNKHFQGHIQDTTGWVVWKHTNVCVCALYCHKPVGKDSLGS